ncbi:Acyltransferase-like protein, chloroplastic, partial [Mucuna pruriens]
MASVMGFLLSPVCAVRSMTRHRFGIRAQSSDGGSSAVLSSGSDSVAAVNGAPVTAGMLAKVEKKVRFLRGGRDEEKSLAALWDDGYGKMTVSDYFVAAKEMCKSDGGPPRWFCPLHCGPPFLNDSPTLLFLPGMDGTGWGLTLHHQALGKAFEVRCLHIPVHDRTPFEGLVKLVEETVKLEYSLSPNKPIYLVGDSFGGCLALAVAARNPTVDLVLILANPGDPVKMASVNVENRFPPAKKIEQLSYNLTALLPCLPDLANIIPRDTLLWKLKLLKSAAAYANSRLHAVKAEVLVLASGKDNMLPSINEAQRLAGLLQKCKVRSFKDSGHTLLLEDGIGLLTIIKGTCMYRHSSRHDLVRDFIPPSMTEFRYAMDQVVGSFRSVTGSVFFSTLEDGKIVKGLSGVPEEGPVLYVGYHMLLGLELISLTEEFLSQKGIALRGIAHPELFMPKVEGLSTEFSMFDWVKIFGGVPVSASNLFKLLSTKSHVLLYPGGAREALHFKGEEYKLIWPDHPEFVRMAARFGATIVPFGAVGEDDIAELVLDYNDLMKIPIVNDYIKDMSRDSVKFRDETSGEVANQNLTFPVLLPKVPGRFYYLFGKPIRTKGMEKMLKDRESANQMYLHIKSQVETNLNYLLKKREEDPYRNVIDRKMYQISHPPETDPIPSFEP